MISHAESVPALRALTYLAPGIPREFFELVTAHLSAALGLQIQLDADCRSSGPMHGDPDPFAEGRADIGFLCSPSYLYLQGQKRPSVELVPAGFVFADARHAGEPLYFSEVVVRKDHHAQCFSDLDGAVWGYNDECSLSGYFSTLQELATRGRDKGFFGRWVKTGSHLTSIESTLAGSIDGAAIDSVALSILMRERPDLRERLRIVESFGPFPIQPVVLGSGLARSLKQCIAHALLELGPDMSTRLSRFGLERCLPIDDRAYEEERRALASLQWDRRCTVQ
ncbi:MAG: phosphonate transport system substrate-binding protein [Chlamydiales bacterium]|jgi:phosphonate transport system substrate-binding protein